VIKNDGTNMAVYFEEGLRYIQSRPLATGFFKKNRREVASDLLRQPETEDVYEALEIYISSTNKKSLDWLKSEMVSVSEKAKANQSIEIILVDYYKDSMIQHKYIKSHALKGLKMNPPPHFVFVEFNEFDTITQIEDAYNECFRYKKLSKSFKKNLEKVGNINKLKSETIDVKKKSVTQGGEEDANSSLV